MEISSRQGQQTLDQQARFVAQLDSLERGGHRMENALSQVLESKSGMGRAVFQALDSRMETTDQKSGVESLRISMITDTKDIMMEYPMDEERQTQISHEQKGDLQKFFLSILRYDGIDDRVERITKAHEKTFRWIFERDQPPDCRWSNFRIWLESDSKLFWVTGKAGSGKSTLMKFICQFDDSSVSHSMSNIPPTESAGSDPRCAPFLRTWAGGRRLVIATFFFWNSGSEIQRNQHGLWCSLLYQILSQLPNLIELVSPRRWELLCLFNGIPSDWAVPDLISMLRVAVKEASKTSSVCLFVDGLDEFDGDYGELIAILRDVGSIANVKLCVSSRPWTEFRDIFEQDANLMLHELTYADIKQYVATRMQADPNFNRLRRLEEVYAGDLMDNVTTKASGVFLWVNLVVTSLLLGMQNGDRVVDLQMRLDQLPPDLEDLYDKILSGLDPLYRGHATKLFKIVEVSYQPLPLLVLWFADELDLASSLKQPIREPTADEITVILETMRRRLDSRCKGLLELSPQNEDIHEMTVQYLHRTVKDYMSSEKAQNCLGLASTAQADAHRSLCHGTLACMKNLGAASTSDPSKMEDARNVQKRSVRAQFLVSAEFLQEDETTDVLNMIDHYKTFSIAYLSTIFGSVSERYDLHQENSVLGRVNKTLMAHVTKPCRDSDTNTGLLAIFFGLDTYIKARSLNMSQKLKNTLLYIAILCITHRIRVSRQFKSIEILLHVGADPNAILTSCFAGSIWADSLTVIMLDFKGPPLSDDWIRFIRLMIQHGAKVEWDHIVKSAEVTAASKRSFIKRSRAFQTRINPDLPEQWHEFLYSQIKDLRRDTAVMKQPRLLRMSQLLGRK